MAAELAGVPRPPGSGIPRATPPCRQHFPRVPRPLASAGNARGGSRRLAQNPAGPSRANPGGNRGEAGRAPGDPAGSPDAIRALTEAAASGGPGAETAFTRLVTLFRDRVVSVAGGMLGDADQAEDVAQEVFLKVHANGSTPGSTGSPSAPRSITPAASGGATARVSRRFPRRAARARWKAPATPAFTRTAGIPKRASSAPSVPAPCAVRCGSCRCGTARR
jgi:hypothetical protein